MNATKPKIYADFQNADVQGRLRLNCVGTLEDLAEQKIELREGLCLTLYADDLDAEGKEDQLVTDGIVAYSQEEHCWVAAIDWAAVRPASDHRKSGANVSATGFAPPVEGKW